MALMLQALMECWAQPLGFCVTSARIQIHMWPHAGTRVRMHMEGSGSFLQPHDGHGSRSDGDGTH